MRRLGGKIGWLMLALLGQTEGRQRCQDSVLTIDLPPPHPLPNCFHVADTLSAAFGFSVLAVAISVVRVWSLGGRKHTSAKGLNTCTDVPLLACRQRVAFLVRSGLGDPVTL